MADNEPGGQRNEVRQDVERRATSPRFYESDATQAEIDRTERRQREEKQAEEAKRLKDDRRTRIDLWLAVGEFVVSATVLWIIWQQSAIFTQQTDIQNAQVEIAANQAKIAAKQTLLAQQSMVAEHRPWMFVTRPVLPPLKPSADHPMLLLNYGVSKLKAWIEIKNYGDGPAIEVAMMAWTTEYGAKIRDMPRGDCGVTEGFPTEKRTVPPGETLIVPADHVEPADPAERVRREHDPDFWMFGRLEYFDMFGQRHVTVFGWSVLGENLYAQVPGMNCAN